MGPRGDPHHRSGFPAQRRYPFDPLETPGLPGVELYFKDESSHPTGSLKHRLARSLFLYALCNGWLRPAAPVIEASSGSTAISEAYFARLLGLPFIAVMPASTSKEKIAQIAFYGGQSHLVEDPTQIYAESERLARESGGHFMDQFTYAERATDWRANNNIAESIFQQMRHEPYPTPTWLISSPGTGGTLATLGRYVRYRQHCTRVLCADAERSVFFDAYVSGDRGLTLDCGSRIEGIGRPRVEASFLPEVIDAMVKVPDAWSLAAMHYLARRLGRRVGGSSGTNLIGAWWPHGKWSRPARRVRWWRFSAMAANAMRPPITIRSGWPGRAMHWNPWSRRWLPASSAAWRCPTGCW